MKYFKEFTLVNPNPYCEIMADITDSGKIQDLYCYSDNIPTIENNENGRQYKVSVKEGKNPLFVHIKDKARIFKLLVNNGYIFLLNEEDDDYNDDVNLIQTCLLVNNTELQLWR